MLALTVIVDLCAKWHFGFMEVKDKVPESQLDLPEVLEDVPNWTLVMLVLTQIVPVQSCYCPDCVHDGLLQPINVRQELGHICSCSAEFWGDQKEKRSSSQSVTLLTPQGLIGGDQVSINSFLPDEVSLQADDTLDDLLLRVLGGTETKWRDGVWDRKDKERTTNTHRCCRSCVCLKMFVCHSCQQLPTTTWKWDYITDVSEFVQRSKIINNTILKNLKKNEWTNAPCGGKGSFPFSYELK